MNTPDVTAVWHRRPWAGWLIRAFGVLLLLAAWRAGVGLIARHHVEHADAIDDGLAAIAFLGASAGSASALLGAHLFDQVPIASRWGLAPTLDPAKAKARVQSSFSSPLTFSISR